MGTVIVLVILTVETEGVARTDVTPLAVTVIPTGHVVTEVMIVTVVVKPLLEPERELLLLEPAPPVALGEDGIVTVETGIEVVITLVICWLAGQFVTDGGHLVTVITWVE